MCDFTKANTALLSHPPASSGTKDVKMLEPSTLHRQSTLQYDNEAVSMSSGDVLQYEEEASLAEKTIDAHIHQYLKDRGYHRTAEKFIEELPQDVQRSLQRADTTSESKANLLFDWWAIASTILDPTLATAGGTLGTSDSSEMTPTANQAQGNAPAPHRSNVADSNPWDSSKDTQTTAVEAQQRMDFKRESQPQLDAPADTRPLQAQRSANVSANSPSSSTLTTVQLSPHGSPPPLIRMDSNNDLQGNAFELSPTTGKKKATPAAKKKKVPAGGSKGKAKSSTTAASRRKSTDAGSVERAVPMNEPDNRPTTASRNDGELVDPPRTSHDGRQPYQDSQLSSNSGLVAAPASTSMAGSSMAGPAVALQGSPTLYATPDDALNAELARYKAEHSLADAHRRQSLPNTFLAQGLPAPVHHSNTMPSAWIPSVMHPALHPTGSQWSNGPNAYPAPYASNPTSPVRYRFPALGHAPPSGQVVYADHPYAALQHGSGVIGPPISNGQWQSTGSSWDSAYSAQPVSQYGLPTPQSVQNSSAGPSHAVGPPASGYHWTPSQPTTVQTTPSLDEFALSPELQRQLWPSSFEAEGHLMHGGQASNGPHAMELDHSGRQDVEHVENKAGSSAERSMQSSQQIGLGASPTAMRGSNPTQIDAGKSYQPADSGSNHCSPQDVLTNGDASSHNPSQSIDDFVKLVNRVMDTHSDELSAADAIVNSFNNASSSKTTLDTVATGSMTSLPADGLYTMADFEKTSSSILAGQRVNASCSPGVTRSPLAGFAPTTASSSDQLITEWERAGLTMMCEGPQSRAERDGIPPHCMARQQEEEDDAAATGTGEDADVEEEDGEHDADETEVKSPREHALAGHNQQISHGQAELGLADVLHGHDGGYDPTASHLIQGADNAQGSVADIENESLAAPASSKAKKTTGSKRKKRPPTTTPPTRKATSTSPTPMAGRSTSSTTALPFPSSSSSTTTEMEKNMKEKLIKGMVAQSRARDQVALWLGRKTTKGKRGSASGSGGGGDGIPMAQQGEEAVVEWSDTGE